MENKKKARRSAFQKTKKQPEWRRVQKENKFKRWFVRISFAALSLLIVFLSYQFWNFLSFVKSPLSQAPNTSAKSYVWDGKHQLNFLLLQFDDLEKTDGKIVFASLAFFDPASSRLRFLIIPVDISFLAQDSYITLQNCSNPTQNIDLLLEIISENLALPIDGYLVTDQRGLNVINADIRYDRAQGFEDGFSDWQQALFSWRNLLHLKRLKTDLYQYVWTDFSPQEIFALLGGVRTINPQDSSFFEIKANLTLEQNLPQIGKVVTIDTDAFDLLASKNFSEDAIQNERLTIEILNSTKISGLALETARLIKNMGGEVIEVGNQSERKTETYIEVFVDKPENYYTLARFAQILNCTVVNGNSEDQLRAQIRIVLGDSNQ
ncbi:hypothetical protein COS81_00670 [candidate division WWE3 bacterium CG06_land_8_20_14_3_00_42_16]|uniref:LytR/CpsA/Psr regulator C-terminal domain-containing protein n=3 Tax=Katanobacteria TaxID=422282 RepID=A0A2M7APH2_UNCKA|nr:MAG: hypothetical protein COS81_00670 [candidate division WWE3 bacterium CG06_land_8_20_14_3_00_42_16]PJA38189.1 MAG: hypothetical protein CO181_00955 [candidate division WWE3 bacterium CG_4_9_14_3_um_filter_43_9]PJC68006.1 MAG: hypothetical protein CO015_05575 [candidate division WWE3 bacterium CG_4_8_14_3_um_filter_42_11]